MTSRTKNYRYSSLSQGGSGDDSNIDTDNFNKKRDICIGL